MGLDSILSPMIHGLNVWERDDRMLKLCVKEQRTDGWTVQTKRGMGGWGETPGLQPGLTGKAYGTSRVFKSLIVLTHVTGGSVKLQEGNE
jgi:hypothetical protein